MTVEPHLMLQELTLLPGGEWSRRREGWLVARLAEGSGYWLEGGMARELGAGNMVVTNGAGNGLLRASSLGLLKVQFFVTQLRLLSGLLAVTDWQQLESGAALPAGALVFAPQDHVARRFAELVDAPARAGLALRCHLLQVWADAVAGVMAGDHHGDALELRERFRETMSQMSEAELAGCSLNELATDLHCSERHLSRLFRQEFGVPFRVRQTEMRLNRARQLLTETNAKIINVAYDSGYRHLGLFNTMFKKRFGMTPSLWRQSARGGVDGCSRTHSGRTRTPAGAT